MRPTISVVIPTYNAAATVARCLRSVFANSYRGGFEVIVVDSSTDATPTVVAERFPEVKLQRLPARAFPGDARNLGVAHSTGEVIAFLDADCIADSHWLEEIGRAHADPTPAFGGVVDNGNPESYVGWASYFCKFSQWMPQATERPMVEIPTCCLAIKRSAFESYGPFLEGTLSSDSAFNWTLSRAGAPPRLVPRIKVAHINRDRIGAVLSNLARHGRDFAAVRVQEQRLSGRQRFAFALLAPLLPPLLFGRVAARVARNRMYVRQFLLAAPLVMLGQAVWAWGELRGYLAPTRRARAMQTSDLREEKPMSPQAEPPANGKISVVVSAFDASDTIVPCLEALLGGDYRGPYEITVVDSSTDDTAQIVADRFPDVRLCKSGRRLFPGEARNLGLSESTGEIVAFLDGDCVPHPDWLSQIARAHRDPIPGIGGVVENANSTARGWVSYFCKLSGWMPRSTPEEARDLPSETLSVKRWAFSSYGPFLEGTYSSAMAFSWRLGEEGHPPWVYPSIRVSRVAAPSLRTFLGTEQPQLGRAYARIRVREQGFSTARRLVYVLMSPALPFLLFARSARRVLRQRRYVRPFLLNSPLIFLGYSAWIYGEVRGYLSRPDPATASV